MRADAGATTVTSTLAPATSTIVTDAPPTPERPAATAAPVPSGPPTTTEAPTTTTPVAVEPVSYTVRDVIDGDTIDILASDGQAFRVRLVGIDAPETDTCEGGPARDAMFWLAQDKPVTLTPGGDGEDTDRYGRFLRYVDVDGVDAGLSMIQQGHAIARFDSRDGYGLHIREADYVAADALSADYVCPPPPTPTPQPVAQMPATPPTASYANCDAVRAAGAAPIHAGDPGWQQKFDRDRDGVGCE